MLTGSSALRWFMENSSTGLRRPQGPSQSISSRFRGEQARQVMPEWAALVPGRINLSCLLENWSRIFQSWQTLQRNLGRSV